MESGELLGLPVPVMLAFVALLAGLALLARQLHALRQPAPVRRGVHPRPAPRRGSAEPD